MSKPIFVSTNRDPFLYTKHQEFVSQQLKQQKKYPQKHRELLIPIDQFTKKQQWAGKPIRSEGKSSERQSKKNPIFDLVNFKQSLLLKKSKEKYELKNITKKRSYTNRAVTEKVNEQAYSNEKKHSVNKIIIRGGGYNRQQFPEKNNFIKQNTDQVWIHQKQEKSPYKQSPRKSQEKKMTIFEREQAKNFEIYYIGARRISSLFDFTDSEGDPKVMIGDSIAYKYEIISLLGRGSFGRVFKAYDHKKKEYIALKIIKNQQKFTVQAKIEIEILQTAILHDPKLRNNIVRLKGSFIFRGHTCLKFEILNKNLYQFLKETNFAGFSLDLIRRFAIQILQALHFFYKHQIIHCDLKPENILLKEENKSGIKVIDVGSGCFEGKQIYTYIQSRFYRAPQIVLGIKYTTAIDMWSFGCILVQLYTGIPLFPGQNENEQMLMFIQLLGLPPPNILIHAERRKKFFTEQFKCKIPPSKNKQKLRDQMNWNSILGADCDKNFLDLVKKCLNWDGKLRMTPKEGLLHEWIINGLPQSIRVQHVDQLNNQ